MTSNEPTGLPAIAPPVLPPAAQEAKWRKKPVVIEAMQFDGTIRAASAICQWANAGDAAAGHDDPTVSYIARDGDDVTAHDMVIWTLEGDMTASPGDWIIRGVQGEFYPCKPDIFAATYEPAKAALAASKTEPSEAVGPIPDAETLRLHMGELTTDEVLIAQAAYRLALIDASPKGGADAARLDSGTFLDQPAAVDGVPAGCNCGWFVGDVWPHHEACPALDQQPAAPGIDWQHVANEYADAAYNALDGMKCIRDGLQPVDAVIESQQRNIERIRTMHWVRGASPKGGPLHAHYCNAQPADADCNCGIDSPKGYSDVARLNWLEAKCVAVADVLGEARQLYYGTYSGSLREAIDADMQATSAEVKP